MNNLQQETQQPISVAPYGITPSTLKRTVNGFSSLSLHEETSLAEDVFYRSDINAANRLVVSHLSFVIHLSRTLNGYGLSQDDLIQEGNVGLMKAVKRFNPNKGVRLVSFAAYWIKAEMYEFILRNWRIVRIATTKEQRKLFFNLRSAKTGSGWLTSNDATSIAERLNVKPKNVLEMEGRLARYNVRFDADNDSDENSSYIAPEHYIEDNSFNPEYALEKVDLQQSTETGLSLALKLLDDRSRDIINQRWLNEEKKSTLNNLAHKYKISAERVRQLEKRAMEKMKSTMQPIYN